MARSNSGLLGFLVLTVATLHGFCSVNGSGLSVQFIPTFDRSGIV